MNALRTVALGKRYGRTWAVDHVTMTVAPGDIYGFVGRNGAGKSTLMKMVAGLSLPTEGYIELFGDVVRPGETSSRVGSIIEGPGVHPNLSGLDNVMCRALALGSANPRAISGDVLEFVGLSDVAKHRAGSYSLGMKQRLGLALALVGSPDLLLLDEPFNGLDPEGVRDIRSLITRLNEDRGITVFISSHVLDQLERMVTRYGVIRGGRLVRELTVEDVDRECSDYLCIESPECEMALAVLERARPDASLGVYGDGSIRVDSGLPSEEAGWILAEAGIPVSAMYRHSRDIEDYFVELMDQGISQDGRSGGGASC
ncbi:ABC transporter ATP-binding protein [Raoultibacter timonensis]|uniref:Bacitracin ABC transporter ATP-binding protein n=1 Tax=Raoultibacter timonensis TaxID=1907662 RepID=A0ABN6MK52_9ACTN|nr:ATP-binding cassette domain-containing protein [Raoultibacter timonensis]BDE97107.1 bacitracin ABC transporter ATP-binding protein [Raoultibacter timonensis]BDF51711.1 bacitracin ABC transporter ATP-binding protein [Raoultibacter timonensis]